MGTQARPLAIVTGASSGVGLELAKCCAEQGFDLLTAANGPEVEHAANTLRGSSASIQAVAADLTTVQGVDKLYAATRGRPVAALLANLGRGLGRAFLDEHVTSTVYLIQRVGREMRARGQGRILVTGSIAGCMPGTYPAVYNGTKALLDSVSFALRAELNGSGVSVTCLMPAATEAGSFEHADIPPEVAGARDTLQPAHEVATIGFEAMMRGDRDVVAGWDNAPRTIARIKPARATENRHI